jgi:hypothetical protein
LAVLYIVLIMPNNNFSFPSCLSSTSRHTFSPTSSPPPSPTPNTAISTSLENSNSNSNRNLFTSKTKTDAEYTNKGYDSFETGKKYDEKKSDSNLIGALKEWAIICRALEDGNQVLLFRKGGIMEFRKGFELKHKNFLLFPTFEHQSMESIRDDYRGKLEELEKEGEHQNDLNNDSKKSNSIPSLQSSSTISRDVAIKKLQKPTPYSQENVTKITSFVEITHFNEVSDIDELEKLQKFHIWNLDYVKMRFNYNPKKPLYLLLLRTYKLNEAIKIANRPEWAGCKSWIQIDAEADEGLRYIKNNSLGYSAPSTGDTFEHLKSISKPCIDDNIFNKITEEVRGINQ